MTWDRVFYISTMVFSILVTTLSWSDRHTEEEKNRILMEAIVWALLAIALRPQ